MKIVKVGRGSKNDIVIRDKYVSTNHCEFIQDDNGNYWVIDTDSKNGTYVNDIRRSGKTKLNQNDQVRIGHTICPWESYFRTTTIRTRTNPIRNRPRIITIGRNPDSNIFIDDRKASRQHCRIEYIDRDTIILEDTGSKNGTYVNGLRINRRTPLRSGDKVKVGSTYVPWEHYINPGGTIDGGLSTGIGIGTGTGVPVSPGTGFGSGKGPVEPSIPPTDTPTEASGILTFVFGVASIGCIIYIVVNYLTSAGFQLINTFGGTGDSLKLFPIYLRGYLGIGGQWVPMIAAVALGILTDLISTLTDEKESSLASFGQWLGNAGFFVGGVFILLAIFAEKIVESL